MKTRFEDIAVIVVNYGIAELAIEAVESVLTHTHGGRTVTVHVVDNNSPGDDAAILEDAWKTRDWGDRVKLWIESENHGFGRGNNIVLRALDQQPNPPGLVFLLNPDARLDNEAIDILASVFEANPDVGAAGAGILHSDGTPASAAFRFPDLTSEVIRVLNFGPVDRMFAHKKTSLPPDYPTGPVDWVSGACVMFRLSAIREVDFFDPGFFLYFEEVDLMHRLRAKGWITQFEPQARVTHVAGASTQLRPGEGVRRKNPPYLYESWRHYFLSTHGRVYAVVTAFLMLLAAVLTLLQARLRGQSSWLPHHFFGDQIKYVLAPLLGLRRQ